MVSSCGDGCSAAQLAGLLVVLIGSGEKNLSPSRHKEKMRAVTARWRWIAGVKVSETIMNKAQAAPVLQCLIWCAVKIFHLIWSFCPHLILCKKGAASHSCLHSMASELRLC
jgi:hypothetical protein